MDTYKKKYEEALEKARNIVNSINVGLIGKDSFEAVFPELAESEDERIRKGIISAIKEDWPGHTDWIAWLEDKAEHLENYDEAEKEKCDFVSDGFIKCYADFLDFKEGNTYWLEYVGDDRYVVRSDNLLGKTYHITPCQLYTIFKKQTWLEKQNQKELTDMSIKEKAHQIAWETSKHYDPLLSKECWCEMAALDMASWLEKQVPIDKEKVLIGARKGIALSIMNFLDRNTLGMCLSSMECADLEDAVVNSDWSKVYDYMKKKLEKQGKDNMGISEATKKKLEDNLNEALEKETPESWNKFLDEGDEQKPVWSEEDEYILFHAINDLKFLKDTISIDPKYAVNITNIEREINLLKSIKDRVQPQPKQEWSEEDDNCLLTIIAEFSKCAGKSVSKDEWMRCNDFLNSLRDRVQSPAKQEWSEKDKKILEIITSVLQVNFGPTEKFLGYEEYMNVDLINWLKSLRPQNTWKPSDEQMKALRLLNLISGISYAGQKQELIDLYKDLKKLKGE